MTRRRSISMLGRIGDMQRSISPLLSSSVSQDDIINKINKLRETYNQEAYSRYNAKQFNSAVIPSNPVQVTTTIVPEHITTSKDVLPIRSVMQRIRSVKQPVKSYTNDQKGFVNDIYDSYYRTLTSGGTSDADARRQARFLAQKAALETGYGSHMANTHNYGGHRTKEKGWLEFKSMDDYTQKDVKLLDKKWSNWRNSITDEDFVKAITTNNGYGIYAPESEYQNYYGLSNRVKSYLNMNKRSLKCGGKVRPKAFVGALIGAATNIVGGILNANAQERQQAELRRQQEHRAAIERAQSLTQNLGLTQAAQREYEDRFRVGYTTGGHKVAKDAKNVKSVNITDGGYGVQIDNDTFLLRGGSHEDINEKGKTGIGIKVGKGKGKEIEVEGGEVVQKTPNEVRVFSDTLGIAGKTFAELVQLGYNKDELFKIQQAMNGNYGSSRRSLRNGGYISRPVGRISYETGGTIQYINGMYQKKVKYPNSNKHYWQQISEDEFNNLKKQGYTVNGTPKTANPARQVGDAQREVAEYKSRTAPKPGVRSDAYRTAVGDGVRGGNRNMFSDDSKLLTGYFRTNKQNKPATTSSTTSKPASATPMSTRNDDNVYTGRTLPNVTILGERRSKPASATPMSSEVNLNGILDIQEAVDRQRKIDAAQGNGSTEPINVETPKITTPVTTTPATTSVQPRTKLAEVPGYVYDPGYTPQQELDYILGNTVNPTPVTTTPQNSGSATSPENIYLGGYTPQQMEEIMKPSTTTTTVENNPPVNKFGTVFKGVDWASLAADALGSIGSALINYNAASNLQDPVTPVRYSPGKLITNYNISPRLAEASMMRGRMLRDSDEGVSSASRLNRRNAINMYTNNYMDRLYGEKTNKEVELLNADTLNQQQVNSQNVASYNDYMNRLIASRNNRTLLKAQALQSGLTGLGDSIGNLFDQGKQRYSDQQTMRYYSALLPESGRRYLRKSGVDFMYNG